MDGCPAAWEMLPIPDGPLTVGIDGGYVRDWNEKKSHFEVIVGKSLLAFRRDDEKDIISPRASTLGLSRLWIPSPSGACSGCSNRKGIR